jgi:hypothetical protein
MLARCVVAAGLVASLAGCIHIVVNSGEGQAVAPIEVDSDLTGTGEKPAKKPAPAVP